MPHKTWTLTDVDQYADRSEIAIGPEDVGGPARGYSIKKSHLRGGLRDGVDAVEIDNGAFRFVVLPTRGMGVWKAWLGDLEIGWKSPVRGPVHPKFVPLTEPSGLGWLDGFDELLCRCGLMSNGAPEFDEQGKLKYPLHGRIANKPAHFVELNVDSEHGEITLSGLVEESRFHFSKLQLKSSYKTKIGEKGFRLVDEVTNLSGRPAEIQLLYHINFGQPLLDAGAKLIAPLKNLSPKDDRSAENVNTWDSFAGEQAGYAEQVYFMELLGDDAGQTEVLLKNAHGLQGVSLRYSTKQLPYFTLWKNTVAGPDGYVTGLEPGSNLPNTRTYEGEHGRVVKLEPGATARFEVAVEIHPTAESVAKAEKAIAKLQASAKPTIHDKPQKA